MSSYDIRHAHQIISNHLISIIFQIGEKLFYSWFGGTIRSAAWWWSWHTVTAGCSPKGSCHQYTLIMPFLQIENHLNYEFTSITFSFKKKENSFWKCILCNFPWVLFKNYKFYCGSDRMMVFLVVLEKLFSGKRLRALSGE